MKSKHSWKWLTPRLTGRNFGKGSAGKSARSRPALAIERLEDRQVLSAVSPAAETVPPPSESADTQILIGLVRGGLKITQDEFELMKTLGTPSTPTEGKVTFNEFTIKKVVDKASPILFQLNDTIWKFGADLIKGQLTDLKLRAGQDKIMYLEFKLKEVLISSTSPSTQDAALPIVETLFADTMRLVQDLLGIQGSGGTVAEHVALQFDKVQLDFHKIEELAIKGEVDFIKGQSPGLTVDDFQVKIDFLFKRANEAIMDLGDPAASELLPAVQEFEDGIMNLLGRLQGGEDFTGGVTLPPTDDVIT